MKIYRNFLPQEDFLRIKNAFYSVSFPWYFSNGVVDESLEFNIKHPYDFQFVHLIYDQNKINSEHFNSLEPILKKLNIFSIIRIKANLSIRVHKKTINTFHTDFLKKPKHLKLKTGIYYLTTCNGPTLFKNNNEIKSEENTYVEFDSELEHASVFCTNQKRRIVINFNYIK